MWETIWERADIEQHLLQYNRESLDRRRCRHVAMAHDALMFTSLLLESEALLAGIVPPTWYGQDNHLREFLASFAIPDNVRAKGKIPTDILEGSYFYFYYFWPTLGPLQSNHITLRFLAKLCEVHDHCRFWGYCSP
jgi:hypothetical protein